MTSTIPDDATRFELGVDVDLPEDIDADEFQVHCTRLAKIEGLSNFKALKKLVFVSTGLREIEGLEENEGLEHLEIYQGCLSRIANISHLTRLKVLDLSFNNIKVIEGFESLLNLEKLYLSSNLIEKIENISACKKVRVLELGSNNISIVENIEELSDLEELWLGKNKIKEMFLPRRFDKLKLLSLQSNKLKTWSTEFLKNAPKLESLYLGNNYLPDIPQDVIQALPSDSLEELDLASNRLTVMPKWSDAPGAGLPNLKELWMNDNRVSDFDSLDNLSACPGLQTVYLERNLVQTQVPVEYLRKMKSICKGLAQLDSVPIQRFTVIEDHVAQVSPILKH